MIVSFCVDDIEKSNKKLYKKSLKEILLFGRKEPDEISMSHITSLPKDLYEVVGCSSKEELFSVEQTNPLLVAVHESFNNHLPLAFSPDIIWNTIIQGISQHINLNAEKYRKFLVSHDDKKELSIIRLDLSLDRLSEIGENITTITNEFLDKIKQDVISKDIFQIINNKFSTTTQIELTANAITCMEAFSPYYSYHMLCGCGFPEIRLHGYLNDYLNIREKIDKIEKLFYIDNETNLNWWTEKLKIILDNFILAMKEEPDINWWKRMYKQVEQYLSYSFNGWIGWLYPYTKINDFYDGEKWCENNGYDKNPMLNNIKDENKRTFNLDIFSEHIKSNAFMSTKSFPTGLSKVDLKITDIEMHKSIDTVLIGGFLGVKQENDGCLTALIGYALLV